MSQYIEQKDYMSDISEGKLVEAYQRTMVVQLYYAVFNISVETGKKFSDIMESEDNKFIHDPKTVHGAIRSYFSKLSGLFCSYKEIFGSFNRIPELLSSLHELRKDCHYNGDVKDIYTVCEDAIDIALEVKECLGKINIFFDKKVQLYKNNGK